MTSTNQVAAKDITQRWPKFTQAEADALKSPENLSAQVMKTYNMPKLQADADVKAWLAGRTF